jgi:hypothetical protein
VDWALTVSSHQIAVVRTIESQMERNRRLQEKESAAQLNATLDKMRGVFDQARESAATETKNELRKIAHE